MTENEPVTPTVAYVVSHTHWDREWYLPYRRFRVMLVEVVRRVLDRLENDDAFEHFLLDGQSIALEDHLEIHRSDAERIRVLVEAGALSIGPWYVLPDEFLVSGEATVRNLLIGHRVCAALGGAQRVGYMPDSFGHIAQMPQILRRAGIDSFVFTRGHGDEVDFEFLWRAPDGSEVLAINQCDGYCGAGGLGHEELWHAHTTRDVDPHRAVEKVRALFEKHATRTGGDVVLISNGCDHLPPQPDLGPILDALRAEFPDCAFSHASLGAFLDAVRAGGFVTTEHSGELFGGRDHLILSGVWSARMPLKQMNDEAQTALASVLEPASTWACFVLGREYPGGLIESAWKLLLENHPHDSICGCSTDEVHREMIPRFMGVLQTAEQILIGHLDHVAPSFGRKVEDDRDTVIAVLNTLPVPRREVVERMVVLQPLDDDLDRLGLFDDDGRPVPHEVVERRFVERFWCIDYRSVLSGEEQRARFRVHADRFADRILRGEDRARDSDCFLTIRFVADLPALGHRCYALRERGPDEIAPEPPGFVTVAGDTIENDLVSVRLHGDGRFDLTDRGTGRVFPGLGRLEDTEDVGDEYDYSRAVESRTVGSASLTGKVDVVEDGGHLGALRARFTMQIPRAIESDRRRRAVETVACPVRTTVRLRPGSPVVEVEIAVDNRAEDHRLRVEFPTPLVSDVIVSDGQFLVLRRPVDPPEGERWIQPPPGTVPQRDFSAVEDERGGLAVMNRGLPEAQAFRDGGGGTELSVTLLRCIGWLSRDDFESRRSMNAGPTLFTPDAQCPGPHRFRLAVMPYAGNWLDADVKGHAERWRVPPLSKQGVLAPGPPGGRSLLESLSPRTNVTAVKKCEWRETLVVRVVNLSSERTLETLVLGLPIREAWRLDLLETRESSLDVDGACEIPLSLDAFEIATIEVELDS